MAKSYSLHLNDVTKQFSGRIIFKGITRDYTEPGIYGITGPNGSGKSTLVKMILGLLSVNRGTIVHKSDGKDIIPEALHNYLGFVSPYLVMYEEFNALENLRLAAGVRGVEYNEEECLELLKRFTIYERRKDPVKAYSSGMKQRLKYVASLHHHPDLLVYDEPVSNLDDEGKAKVYDLIREKGKDKIVLIASNDSEDLALCSDILRITEHKV